MKGLVNSTGSNKLLVIALAFMAGGGVGFLVARRLLEEHYQELAEEEIQDVISHFREKYEDEEKEEHRKLVNRYDSDKPSPEELVRREARYEEFEEDLLEAEDEDYDEEDYLEEADLSLDFEGSPDGLGDEDEDYAEGDYLVDEDISEEVEPDSDEPYLITYEEFLEEEPNREKIDLYYYRFDQIVCDVNDIIVEHPEDILGVAWLDELKRRTTAFVRDDINDIDYEVHSLSKSYNDDVATRMETDKEKKMRRTARQKQAMDDFNLSINSVEFEEEKPRKPKTKPYKRPQQPRYHEDIPRIEE